jgi:hypothetical protein
VGAEVARIAGRLLDAEQPYERAIISARADGFVNNEAIANELAAQLYAARGFSASRRLNWNLGGPRGAAVRHGNYRPLDHSQD